MPPTKLPRLIDSKRAALRPLSSFRFVSDFDRESDFDVPESQRRTLPAAGKVRHSIGLSENVPIKSRS